MKRSLVYILLLGLFVFSPFWLPYITSNRYILWTSNILVGIGILAVAIDDAIIIFSKEKSVENQTKGTVESKATLKSKPAPKDPDNPVPIVKEEKPKEGREK